MKHLLSGKILAIDMGSRNIHLVEGRSRGGAIEVDRCLLVVTPEGSIRDGSIIDKASVRECLHQAIKQNHFTADRAVLTVKSPLVIARDVVLPVVNKDELDSMIQLEMEQYVPNLVTEYVTGFTLLNPGTDKNAAVQGGSQMKFHVVAMPKTLINSYLELLREAGLKPVIMDVHSNALAKLVDRNFIRNGQNVNSMTSWQTAAFLDLGYDQTEVNIISQGSLVFSRLIAFGSRQICAELAKQWNITLSQTEQRLANDLDLTKSNGDHAQDTIRSFTNRWLTEIQTNIQFYTGRSQENKPEAFYIYGGFARLRGLADLMNGAYNVPIRYMNDLPAVKMVSRENSPDQDIGQFINALGAIIRNE
ncbi:MAG: type IV pilus assembly protein PilM [Clostridiaceae bacterium]|nr:type IV pilus assembly protein PilM [Clostridiaceae bacterium]